MTDPNFAAKVNAAMAHARGTMSGLAPVFVGQDPTGHAIWRTSDGTVYRIPPQSSIQLPDGTNLYNGGLSITSTATNHHPMLSASAPENGLLLPTEKREMPVVGYRGWKWTNKFRLGVGTKGFLGSTGVGGGWNKATETAHCQVGPSPYMPPMPHLSPDQSCGCGLYVIANLDELESHFTLSDEMIVGAVVGWGKVIQHGREGWRAQHCRILGLLDCKYSEAQLKNTRQAAKEYSLPVLERAGLERYVREWGDPFAEPVSA